MIRNNDPHTHSNNINNISYTPRGKVLALEFGSFDYGPQATRNKIVAEQRLSKLKKFSGLNLHNKLKPYKTTIIPALLYPTVSLNSLTFPAKNKLQIVQNKALRFVTNAERYTNNQTLHTT